MGVQVYLINNKKEILRFVDKELVALLTDEIKDLGVKFFFDTTISKIEKSKLGNAGLLLY